jgi:hypothetical protein
MILKFTITISILFLFFADKKLDFYLEEYGKICKSQLEKSSREQAWRNLRTLRSSIMYEINAHSKIPGEKVDKEFIWKMFSKHGDSLVGGSTGDIFVIDLSKGTMFYDNSTNYNKFKQQKFNYKDLFSQAEKAGGVPETMQQAWDKYLKNKEHNPPNDRVTWRFDDADEWLVCMTLPTPTQGFLGATAADPTRKAFQLKVCQGIQSDEALAGWNKNKKYLMEAKNNILLVLKLIIGLFLLSVLVDFVLKKLYSSQIPAIDRRKKVNNCDNCDDTGVCVLSKTHILEVSEEINKNK